MNMAVLPIRRDLKFNLPADKATDWHEAGMHAPRVLLTTLGPLRPPYPPLLPSDG